VKNKIYNFKIINLEKFIDKRGFFFEKYSKVKFNSLGIKYNFVQDNVSVSKKNVLRGLHFQKKYKQGKLLRVVKGKIFDVIVDLRKNKSTFKNVYSFILSENDFKVLWIPQGFAHGFCVLSKVAQVEYKCTDFYKPNDQLTLLWNDETLKIKWPIHKPILSDNDKNGKTLIDLIKKKLI